MGSALAVLAIVAAIALKLLAFGPHWIALVVALAALMLAARFETRSGLFAAAAFTVALAILVERPFVLEQIEINQLRAMADEDAGAAFLLSAQEALAPFAAAPLVLCVLVVAAAAAIALRRRKGGAWRFLLGESDALAALNVGIGRLAALLTVPMIFIIVYDVAQRKLLEIDPGFASSGWYDVFSSTKLQEMEWHLHAVLFLLCLGFAYVRDAHVRIELVRDRLAPRRRAWLEVAGCVLFLIPFCGLMVDFSYTFAERSFAIMESSAAMTGLPYRFIIKSFLPASFLLLALCGLSVALRCCVYLFGPIELRRESDLYAGTHHAEVPATKAASDHAAG